MIKRCFDIFASFCCIVILAIPLLFLMFLVRINLGSPIFFTQLRPGLKGKTFKILKFRTMKNIKDSSGEFLPDEKRITRFGAILRNSSLDELPELWNVLKGDMSLVGPRPLLMEYLPLYSSFQKRRHEVRPGLTGWAQIKGRNTLSWEDKFAYDVWYVDNQSFILDLAIILTTIKKVLLCEGISAEGEVTVQKFSRNGKL